jgi:hypothetical protein
MTNGTNSNGQTHIPGWKNRQIGNATHWLPLGIGTGVALGVTFDNLALGIAIGAAVSAIVGMAMNLSRVGSVDLDTGAPGGRLTAAIAIGGLVLLVVGALFLHFLMR